MPKRLVHVHLGNVGREHINPHETETAIAAKQNAHIDYIGIDKLHLHVPKEIPNWKQLHEDFAEGLRKLDDNSIDIIDSKISLFLYGEWYKKTGELDGTSFDQGLNTLKVAYEKLKPGGEVIVVLPKFRISNVEPAFAQIPFSKVEVIPLTQEEAQQTEWLKAYTGGLRSVKWPHKIIGIK